MSFEADPTNHDPADKFYDLMDKLPVNDGPQGPYQHADGLLAIGGMFSAYRDDSFCRVIITTPRFLNEYRWDPRFVNETAKFISTSGDLAIQTDITPHNWDTLLAFTHEIINKSSEEK